jgi:hypothetical protein
VFGLGISAMNNLDFGGGLLEILGRLLTGALLLLIAALVPLVAFRFFDFLGEEAVSSMHSGAQAGVARSRDVLGRMDPRRVADRLHGDNGAGRQPAGQPDRPGSSGQPSPAEQQPGGDQPALGRGGPDNPASSGTKAGTGARGAAPAGGSAAGGAGASAAGGAAGAAAAVVGAGVTAGQAAATAGRQAGQQASQQQPRSDGASGSRPAAADPPSRR